MKKKLTYITMLTLAAGTLLAAETTVELPSAIERVVEFLLGLSAPAKAIGKVVGYSATITVVAQIAKAVLVAFQDRVSPKYSYAVVSLLGLLTLIDQAVTSGDAGAVTWAQILISLASTAAAFFGYKVIFSPDAPVMRASARTDAPKADLSQG